MASLSVPLHNQKEAQAAVVARRVAQWKLQREMCVCAGASWNLSAKHKVATKGTGHASEYCYKYVVETCVSSCFVI